MKRTALKSKTPLRVTTSLRSVSKLSSNKRMSSKSKKQSKIDSDYHKMLSERDVDLLCTGCGTSDQLTNSHLVPRSRRSDLISNPKNIRIHCLECHNLWESSLEQKQLLMDYDECMSIVQQLDPIYYELILNKG